MIMMMMISDSLPYSTINSSTYSFIISLYEFIISLSNINIKNNNDIDYKFFHSPPTADEINVFIYNSNSSLYQCNGCLYDCSTFVIDESHCYTKSYMEFLSNILINTNISTEIQRDFGWKSLGSTFIEYKSMLNNTYINNDNDNIRLEAGGGGGVGFQLYCDDDMIMTTGGGGGSGIEGSILNSNSTNHASYGTGGGAGIQIKMFNNSNSNDNDNDWVSIGGGGGCGTNTNNDNDTNYDNTFTIPKLQCGIKLDDSNSNNYRKYIEDFKHKLRTCNSIRGNHYHNHH